jgi:hypothetical protein
MMMTMTRIEQIWSELENDKSFSHGLLVRRYSGDVLPDIFVAVKMPEGFRCIAASFSDTKNLNISMFTHLRDISLEIIPDEQNHGRSYLIFKLLNADHKDIFSVLCEDLILSVSPLKREEQVLKELINRFEKWKSLFDKVSSHGLTPEEQRGLFGELVLLKKLLLSSDQTGSVLSSWIGTEKQIRDFQYNSWAIEVKTTLGNNHQKIQISSERQLDTRNLKHLFLYHLSMESRLHSGETLNDLIDSVRLLLDPDFAILNRFNSKLLEAGYFEIHRSIYSDTGYFIRNEAFYKVENDFPRIEEIDIRKGVGDVSYSIIISQFTDYFESEESVLQNVIFL